MDLNKSKVQTRSRSSFDGNGSSKSEFKIESDGNNNKNEKNNKYQSKLHEKLVFLEGKVKRIASDIKKTKEMLDLNNLDASKVILSDIQDKISGIKKAMVHVVTTTTTTTTTTHDDDDDGVDEKKMKNKQLGMVDKRVLNDGFQCVEGKSFVKGLNSEELEARLFPHHKLIRDRTLIKGKDDHDNGSVVKPKVEDKVLSPVDHNSIAMEFLDSLWNEKSKVSVPARECEVQETGGDGDGNGGNKVVYLVQRAVPLALTSENDPMREELKKLQEKIDMLAHKQMRRILWCGLGFGVITVGLFFRLTFWEFSWDVMEPIAFFTTTTGLVIGYACFLFTSRDPTYQDFMKWLFLSRQRKLFKRQNFDLERFKELQCKCKTPLGASAILKNRFGLELDLEDALHRD